MRVISTRWTIALAAGLTGLTLGLAGCSDDDNANVDDTTRVDSIPTESADTPPPVPDNGYAARIRTTTNGVPHILAADLGSAGYGEGYAAFTHRLGHGIGMEGHEEPYLDGGNDLPLAPGMTFSD